MSWQLQPDPELGRKAPLSPLAENTTCVVPELAEVPVLRTVKVQVPLGVEVVPDPAGPQTATHHHSATC